MPDLDDVPRTPATADELYEVYRTGMLTRHLCRNGRLDELTWLRERGTRTDALRDLHRRRHPERFRRAGSLAVEESPDMVWWPIDLPYPPPPPGSSPGIRPPQSAGGGDNPLLTGGMALAALSLESMHGVSEHSLAYARQLFGYFLQCEVPGRGGFFVRVAHNLGPPRTRVKLASTDEILGMCVGLLYYCRALEQVGDQAELAAARGLVRRMAANIGAHGYWIVPWADDFYPRPDVDLDSAFRDEPGGDQVWSRQAAFMFGYAFRVFFKAVGDFDTDCLWDESEYDKYFPEWLVDSGNVSTLKWKIAADAAVQSGFDTANGFFELCLAAASYFDSSLFAQVRRLSIDVTFNVTDKIVHNYYSLHLFGLASLLVLECTDAVAMHSAIGLAFATLVGDGLGYKNAFFGLLARRGGFTGEPVDRAVSILTTVPRPGVTDCFPPGLPLAGVRLLHLLAFPAGSEPVPELDRPVPDPETVTAQRKDLADVRAGLGDRYTTLLDWHLPVMFNCEERWGEERTWEHASTPDSGHCFGRHWGLTAPPGLPLWREFVNELFAPGSERMPLVVEAPGVDLLFPRMLAAHWGLLPVPVLPRARDVCWATLPHWGATPIGGPPIVFPELHSESERKSKRLVGLVRRGGEPVPDLGLVDGLHCGDGLHPGDRAVLYGFEHTILHERFRGRRIHVYDDRIPALGAFAFVADRCSHWEFYVEGAATAERLERAPRWAPVAQDTFDGTIHRFAVKRIGDERTGYRVDLNLRLDPTPFAARLPTSFSFWVLRARRLPLRDSVGHDEVLATPVFPLRFRCGRPPADRRYRYVLNAHQGTVHDLAGEPSHMSSMWQCRSALILPIEESLAGLSPERLDAVLRSVAATGVPHATGEFPALPLPRRDRYEGWPPIRLNEYWRTHPAARAEYDRVNMRRPRLCSRCFR